MFFCIPIIFGCQTSLKPEGEQQQARVCPRCHNASVIAAKSTTWFEVFWVPLIPFSKKHVWICGICQWQAQMAPGQGQPGVGQHQQPGQSYGQNNFSQGYSPAYLQQVPPKQ